MSAHQPPHELTQMGLNAATFFRSDARSWRGECPRCGGHRRLLVFSDHPFPKWRVACDECGLKAWADELAPALRQPVSEELRREWATRNASEQASRDETRRLKLKEFESLELWKELHERMASSHRDLWRDAGIPDEWQDFWQLGYTEDKTYKHADELLHSPALTIPYFHHAPDHWQFCTMQYRLTNAPDPADRYRFESGLQATFYQADPTEPIGDTAVICEGAKKAMAVQIYANPKASVLAIPSKSSNVGIDGAVKGCWRVWVMLDPDAGHAARKLAQTIGKAARVVTLPCKVDDMLTRYGGTAADMKYYLQQAVRV